MPDVANPEIVDTLSVNNMKTIGEAQAFQMGLAAGNSAAWQNVTNQNAVAQQQAIFQQTQLQLAAAAQQQQRLNEIANTSVQSLQVISAAIVGNIGKYLTEANPSQAMSEKALLTSDNLAKQVADLSAAIAAMQGMIKGGQTTPPISSPGPVTGG